MPARDFAHVLKIDFCANLPYIIFCDLGVEISCDFCDGGLAYNLLELNWLVLPVSYLCLYIEISCFCYLCYIFDLSWIPTFITFGWPHVMDTPRNLRN